MAEKAKEILVFIAVAGLLLSIVVIQWGPIGSPLGDADSAGDDASAETDDDDSSEGTSE